MFDEPVEADSGEAFEAFEEMLRQSVQFVINTEPDAEKFINLYTKLATDDFFAFFGYLDADGKDELRCLARLFAMQIWNGTPLPSNNYRPQPLPLPKRNDPCFCGSGRKYKQCCARLDAGGLPLIATEMLTGLLLEQITQAELKQAYLHFSHDLLAFIAGEWAKEDEAMAKRALLLLDPIFKQPDAKLTHRDEMALDAMFEICSALDKPRKKSALIKRMMNHPVKVLQTAALHRQCTILSDQGKDDEAWACFKKAQRINPNDPALSHLEILLLMQQGKTDQMQQRGAYWIKRLGKMNRDGELDELIAMIKEMVSDTPTAMGNLIEHDTPGAARLIAWLKSACQSPPPLLNRIQVYDDASIIEPKNKRAAILERDWLKLLMYCDDPWEKPDKWLAELEAHPELAGSCNVLDDLIQMVRELDTPNPMLTFEPLLMLSMFQVKRLLPEQPKAPLEWGFIQNRPALRMLGFMIASMVQMDDQQTALEMMEWSLRLNPNDNEGMRSEVVNAYLQLGRNEDVVALCEHYPEDIDVSINFGHALALFRLGKEHAANKRLIEAIECSPRIPGALQHKRMKEPKSFHPGYITVGGEDEAWHYRECACDLWADTPGALVWLKRVAKVVK